MFEQSVNKTKEESKETEIGSLADLGFGLIDSAVAKPYNATIGLVAPTIDLSSSYNHKSIAAKVGEFGGSVADMVVLSKVTGWGVGKGLGYSASRGLIAAPVSESLATTLSLGSTGALYGGVFTPGSATERMKNATVGFATFSTMGAATAGLSKLSFLGQSGSRSLAQNMALGGLSGVPAGLVETEVSSLVNGNGLTLDPVTLGKSALFYGAFGATMSGAGHALARGQARVKSLLSETGTSSEMPRPKVGEVTVAAKDKVAETPVVDRSRASQVVEKGGTSQTQAERATKPFDIPKTGNIELGRMMREASPADQIRLVQEVIASRPNVPVGSWMRLIGKEEMPTFLRAIDKMYSETALRNAEYLIETRNLRPPTPESPPIDFKAWEEALRIVKSEKTMPVKSTSETNAAAEGKRDAKPGTEGDAKPKTEAETKPASEAVKEPGAAQAKPFTYNDVTMSVKDPALLRESIKNNGATELGAKILDYANRWATIMERKIAAGEPITPEMARKASSETGVDVRNFEHDMARNVLADTWKHGIELRSRVPSDAEALNVALAEARVKALTPAQEAEVNNVGGMMLSLANSRAHAIEMVKGADPTRVDPVVKRVLLDDLLNGQTFLQRMGVDKAESIPSIVNAMRNVPEPEIPRFIHYADQFRHESWANSVMHGMDQAVAKGNIAPGTQKVWIDEISAKMRRVFPFIPEAEWAITKLKNLLP